MLVRMIRDRFVTGHRDCDLRRHLDSVECGKAMLSWLLRTYSPAPAPVPASPPRSATTDMETILQHLLLLGTPTPVLRSSPVPARRDWTTVVCFSCGKPGHGVSRCPHLDETLPYMLPGWSAEKVDGQYIYIYLFILLEYI